MSYGDYSQTPGQRYPDNSRYREADDYIAPFNRSSSQVTSTDPPKPRPGPRPKPPARRHGDREEEVDYLLPEQLGTRNDHPAYSTRGYGTSEYPKQARDTSAQSNSTQKEYGTHSYQDSSQQQWAGYAPADSSNQHQRSATEYAYASRSTGRYFADGNNNNGQQNAQGSDGYDHKSGHKNYGVSYGSYAERDAYGAEMGEQDEGYQQHY